MWWKGVVETAEGFKVEWYQQHKQGRGGERCARHRE